MFAAIIIGICFWTYERTSVAQVATRLNVVGSAQSNTMTAPIINKVNDQNYLQLLYSILSLEHGTSLVLLCPKY